MNLFSFKIKKIFFFIGILMINAATQAQDVLDFVAINDYVTTPLDAYLQTVLLSTWSGRIKPAGASGCQIKFGMET